MKLQALGYDYAYKSQNNQRTSKSNDVSFDAKVPKVKSPGKFAKFVRKYGLEIGGGVIVTALLASLPYAFKKDNAIKAAKAEEQRLDQERYAKEEAEAVFNYLKGNFIRDNSKIDEQNIKNALDKMSESEFGEQFTKFAEDVNKNNSHRMAIANQNEPNAYKLSSIDTLNYDSSKTSSEILAGTKSDIALGREELLSDFSHDKIITEAGKTVSSTVEHSKTSGGGVIGLIPVVGRSKTSSSSNTTTQSQNAINEYNKVKVQTVRPIIGFEKDNSQIFSHLKDSLSRKMNYGAMTDSLFNAEMKKGHNISQMEQALKELSLKIKHPKEFKVSKEMLKQGVRRVTIKFYTRGLVR